MKIFELKHSLLPSTTGVYAIVNKDTGKFYIGSAARVGNFNSDSGFRFRFRKHLTDYKTPERKHYPIYRAFHKYGLEAFEVWILQECAAEDCLAYEQLYLDLIQPHYNICKKAGSSIGVKHSESTKRKASERMRGNQLSKGRPAWNKGLKMPEEFCEKCRGPRNLSEEQREALSKRSSAVHKGRVWSEDQKRNQARAASISGKARAKTYKAITPEGLEIEFTNAAEFAKENNLSAYSISDCARGKQKQHKGWTFEFKI